MWQQTYIGDIIGRKKHAPFRLSEQLQPTLRQPLRSPCVVHLGPPSAGARARARVAVEDIRPSLHSLQSRARHTATINTGTISTGTISAGSPSIVDILGKVVRVHRLHRRCQPRHLSRLQHRLPLRILLRDLSIRSDILTLRIPRRWRSMRRHHPTQSCLVLVNPLPLFHLLVLHATEIPAPLRTNSYSQSPKIPP